ncbi:unnamed protein product [Candidatus Protochlamydia amoebophila UWE25]|uniref:Uncharacterized protein n=1 Tax=Protochlamydia amoebophila (strain UWE25) TaxID=264201 RepID=A0A2P9H9S9_PARUW|nr:unnamed protein product [Candidatus Protochlamydia amoebophila UWE25]
MEDKYEIQNAPTEKEPSPKEKIQSKDETIILAQVCPGDYAKLYALKYQIGDPRLFLKRNII